MRTASPTALSALVVTVALSTLLGAAPAAARPADPARPAARSTAQLTAQPTAQPTAFPTALAAADPVLGAVGDIACDPSSGTYNGGNGTARRCRHRATSTLALGLGLDRVAMLGDGAYLCGSLGSYRRAYDPTWGRLKGITRPTPGNHDYRVAGDGTGCTAANAGAAGYFGYFGNAAGQRGKGWYSYQLGAWHVVVLNSNCSKVGGCTETSPQGRWLEADLAAHRTRCTLAAWHEPLFASGGEGQERVRPLWRLLYAAGADVVLNGHRHWYERLHRATPAGGSDDRRGIRQFIAGTGGAEHDVAPAGRHPRSAYLRQDAYGVLRLVLHPASYDWRFVTEGGAARDQGSSTCSA